MRRLLAVILATAGTSALAAIPVASAQAAACGTAWSAAPSWTHDDAFLFQASSDAAGDAMVAGYKYIINTAYRPIVLQWNGTRWNPTTVPGHGDDTILTGVAVNSATSAVAVGRYSQGSSGPSRTFAEVWNGSSWSIDLPHTFKDGTTYLPSQLNHAASTCRAWDGDAADTRDVGRFLLAVRADPDCARLGNKAAAGDVDVVRAARAVQTGVVAEGRVVAAWGQCAERAEADGQVVVAARERLERVGPDRPVRVPIPRVAAPPPPAT